MSLSMFIHGWSVSRFISSDQKFQLDNQVFHKKVKKLISSVSSLKRQTCIAFNWKRNSLIQFWENLKRKKNYLSGIALCKSGGRSFQWLALLPCVGIWLQLGWNEWKAKLHNRKEDQGSGLTLDRLDERQEGTIKIW